MLTYADVCWQVEGGLVMSLGYFLTEEVVWSAEGSQLSVGTWQYKPPAVAVACWTYRLV
jgi:xanthine dehydrogenase molybdopterin-binding subunit B